MKLFLITMIVAMACFARGAVQLEVPLHAAGFTIDGNITADEKALSVADTLRMASGYERPNHATQFHLSTTLQGLYVAFSCDEKNTSDIVILATAQGGAVFDDDSVQIFLCAEREINNSNYYHFAVNAGGVQYGSFMRDDSDVVGWTAKTLKTDNGWSAEIFLPFASIRAPQELKFWRANFVRNRPARPAISEEIEITSWQPVGKLLHNFQRFGFLKMPRLVPGAPAAPALPGALSSPPPPAPMAIMPTTTATVTTSTR